MKISRALIPIATAGVLALGAVAVASAATSPSPSPSGSSSTGSDAKANKEHRGGAGNRLLRHALHGELTLGKKDGTETHVAVVQRGEITKVDTGAKTLTMKSPDGFTRTYSVTSDTKIKSKGQEEKFTDLKAGERAMVVADQEGSKYVARVIRCVREAN
jgi:hypothetical protein